MNGAKLKKLLILNLPYFLFGLYATKLGEAWRLAEGADASKKLLHLLNGLAAAFQSPWPSFHPTDLLIGLILGCLLRLLVYEKSRNAKKYRHNIEYGSARWGTHADIAPFIDPDPWNNIILTKTESLTMSSRPKDPRNARNKNVLVVGGSGSGKTRFFIKPNIMQCTKTKGTSIVVTDPKGTLIVETGKLLVAAGYDVRAFNTINFSKSMHYNPFAYIHSEKDILKLVTVLISNTKGEGKAGENAGTGERDDAGKAEIGGHSRCQLGSVSKLVIGLQHGDGTGAAASQDYLRGIYAQLVGIGNQVFHGREQVFCG